MRDRTCFFLFFFFNDTATTEIYTLSLHDALPILTSRPAPKGFYGMNAFMRSVDTKLLGRKTYEVSLRMGDRKSTRLNSSHSQISYAVFCLKKKKKVWVWFLMHTCL